jgi:hypothetical protein
MTISTPFLVSRLQARIPAEFEPLYLRTRKQVTDADKTLGVALLAEAYCDLIDAGTVKLLNDLERANTFKELQEAQKTLEDIKNKIRHYLAWVAGYISNDRLAPVIGHFHAMMYEMDIGDGTHPYIAFTIPDSAVVNAKELISALTDGSAENLDETIDMVIHVVEQAIIPLMIRPKELMKFNFVVDRTINGVLAISMAVYKRVVRKLARKLPREFYPLLGAHLGTFLVLA